MSGCSTTVDYTASNQLLTKPWEEIESMAIGTEVHMYLWGGDEGINQYMDQWVKPMLKQKYEIDFYRHPMNTEDIISKLLTEKKAEKRKGTIDVIWLNGENFRNAKEHELLYGSFVSILPHVQTYIGLDQPYVQYDMGTEIEGLEAPWGKVQFVFHYDQNKVEQPPETYEELMKWIQNHPGQFTYPEVKDFTGNTFVKWLLYEIAHDPNHLSKGFNEAWLQINEVHLWDKLKEMKPYLWREGETYPNSLSQLDQMYASGEVAFTMGFNEGRTRSLIKEGIFPASTKTIVIAPGSISNTHYLSIPFNSPNVAGALVVINFLLSPEAQIKKMDPEMWGEGTVLNIKRLNQQHLNQIQKLQNSSVVSSEHLLPDLDTRYSDWIKEHWENEILRSSQ